MAVDLKPYIYAKGKDAGLDGELAQAKQYGKVCPGQTVLFWKYGLRRYAMPYEKVRRIFRRVEPVYGKLCCGGRSFLIEWLVLVLKDGTQVQIHIGDDVKREAEALLAALKESHPGIAYGKE